MEKIKLKEEGTPERRKWRRLSRVADPDPKNTSAEEEEDSDTNQ